MVESCFDAISVDADMNDHPDEILGALINNLGSGH
jgi:hypothetical protein